MFWLDGKNSQTKIMTATMDGREIKTVLAEANITSKFFALFKFKLLFLFYKSEHALLSSV